MILRRVLKSDFDYIGVLASKSLEVNTLYGFDYNMSSLHKIFDALYRTRDVFFVIIEDQGVRCGWFVATPGHGVPHSFITAMSQRYYQSECSGFKALASLRIVHEAFFKFCESRKYQLAVTSSVLPSQDAFDNVLERDGWARSRGRQMVRPTKFHPSLYG